MNRLLLICLAAWLLSGCGHVGNSLVGGERGFRNFAQSWVGKSIDDATGAKYGCSGGGKLVGDNQVDGLTRERELVWTCWSDQIGKSSECHWALTYRVSDEKILTWRYVSKPQECFRDVFYVGSW